MPIKIYIAGKITGLPYDEYAPKFAAAAKTIREMGHIPLNPVVLTGHLPGGSEWEDYIIIGLEAILRAGDDSAVLMLHGWEDSRGARIEHSLALSLDRTIIYEYRDADGYVSRIWTTKETRDMFNVKEEGEYEFIPPPGLQRDRGVPPIEFFHQSDEVGMFEVPQSISEALPGVKKEDDGSIQQP